LRRFARLPVPTTGCGCERGRSRKNGRPGSHLKPDEHFKITKILKTEHKALLVATEVQQVKCWLYLDIKLKTQEELKYHYKSMEALT